MPLPRSALRMTDEELEAFLQRERTVRIGTVSPNGEPHVAPLWFIWHQGALYLYSLTRSRRARDLANGSRVAACVDAGHDYAELHGVVLYGTLTPVEDPELRAHLRKLLGEKYFGGIDIPEDRHHIWLNLRPDEIVSWDFKKIPAGRDRRLEAQEGASR